MLVPDAHLALHTAAFPERPTAADRARWTAMFVACAALRCPEMAAPDGIPPHEKRRLLFAVLADAVGRKDGTAVAVVLDALAPLLAGLPDNIADLRTEVGAPLPRITGKKGDRGVAVVLWLHLERLLAGVPRCPAALPCPSCREGSPCPRDTWPLALAAYVLPEVTEKTATSFWNPRGQATDERGKGGGRGWAAMWATAPGLADAVLRRCLEFYRARRKLDLSEAVADQVWREGCRDPAVAVIHVQTVAAPGRVADLTVAVADCRDALALRRGSTDRAWEHLALLLSNLHGRLARAQVPPATRHTAQNPARPPRTPRFRRRSVVGV